MDLFLVFQAFWLPTIDDWWRRSEGFCWRPKSKWPAGVSTASSVNFPGSAACSIQIVNKLFAEIDCLSILFLYFYLTLNHFFVRWCFVNVIIVLCVCVCVHVHITHIVERWMISTRFDLIFFFLLLMNEWIHQNHLKFVFIFVLFILLRKSLFKWAEIQYNVWTLYKALTAIRFTFWSQVLK